MLVKKYKHVMLTLHHNVDWSKTFIVRVCVCVFFFSSVRRETGAQPDDLSNRRQQPGHKLECCQIYLEWWRWNHQIHCEGSFQKHARKSSFIKLTSNVHPCARFFFLPRPPMQKPESCGKALSSLWLRFVAFHIYLIYNKQEDYLSFLQCYKMT